MAAEAGMNAPPDTDIKGARIQSFIIDVEDDVLEDLRERLRRTRWPDEVADAGWDYGANLDYLRDLVAYWADRFDWRAQEDRLNSLGNFRAVVDGLSVHFVHERAWGESAAPLLLLHGWPGTSYQMLKLVPLLTGGDLGASFDVVVPSLPGFGFSDRPTKRGMGVRSMAPLIHRLMTEVLGYERYGIRALDLGLLIGRELATGYPDAVIGVHESGTMPFVFQAPTDLSPDEERFVAQSGVWMLSEMGYGAPG